MPTLVDCFVVVPPVPIVQTATEMVPPLNKQPFGFINQGLTLHQSLSWFPPTFVWQGEAYKGRQQRRLAMCNMRLSG